MVSSDADRPTIGTPVRFYIANRFLLTKPTRTKWYSPQSGDFEVRLTLSCHEVRAFQDSNLESADFEDRLTVLMSREMSISGS